MKTPVPATVGVTINVELLFVISFYVVNKLQSNHGNVGFVMHRHNMRVHELMHGPAFSRASIVHLLPNENMLCAFSGDC